MKTLLITLALVACCYAAAIDSGKNESPDTLVAAVEVPSEEGDSVVSELVNPAEQTLIRPKRTILKKIKLIKLGALGLGYVFDFKLFTENLL